jgi:hypothetical protein
MSGLHYPNQYVVPVIGSKDGTTITEVALTAAYSGNNQSFPTAGMSKMNLDISYTMNAADSANSIQVQLEGSNDGVNFFRLPNDETSGATSTITAREFTYVGAAGTNAKISIGLDIFYKFMKVSIKETAATTLGTVFVEATLNGK